MKYTIKTIGDLLTHAEYIGKEFVQRGVYPCLHIVQQVFITDSGATILQSQHGNYYLNQVDFIKTQITK